MAADPGSLFAAEDDVHAADPERGEVHPEDVRVLLTVRVQRESAVAPELWVLGNVSVASSWTPSAWLSRLATSPSSHSMAFLAPMVKAMTPRPSSGAPKISELKPGRRLLKTLNRNPVNVTTADLHGTGEAAVLCRGTSPRDSSDAAS
jgi:hypothetical protein